MRNWFVLVFLFTSCTAFSGFYYDNGVDQTIVHKHLSKQEKKEMQSEILHLLGLQHRPRPSFLTAANRKQQHDKILSSAPRFLIDVYQSLTEEESGDLKLQPELVEREFNVSDTDIYAVDEADTIMSFVNHGRHFHGVRHHHSDGRFWFDLSEVPAQSILMASELRIYINRTVSSEEPNASDESAEWEDADDSDDQILGLDAALRNYTVTLYEIREGDSLIYVDSVEIDGEHKGWVPFNTTSVMRRWLNNPEDNYGLQMVCRENSYGHLVSTSEIGMIGSHGVENLQPFMVAFFRSTNPKNSLHNTTTSTSESEEPEDEVEEVKRSPRVRRQSTSNRKRSKDPEDHGTWNHYADSDSRSQRRSCQKKNLYVSFRDLKWEDWIIAPDGYAAFYCHGECAFPLNAHMNASNHAIVQTLVHLMNPYKIPRPYCAPIKLSSISVLYFDDNSNVILKKYRNMVVKSCGCH